MKSLLAKTYYIILLQETKKSNSLDGAPPSSYNTKSEAALTENSNTNPDSSLDDNRKHKKDGWLHTPDVLMYESVAYSAQVSIDTSRKW